MDLNLKIIILIKIYIKLKIIIIIIKCSCLGIKIFILVSVIICQSNKKLQVSLFKNLDSLITMLSVQNKKIHKKNQKIKQPNLNKQYQSMMLLHLSFLNF